MYSNHRHDHTFTSNSTAYRAQDPLNQDLMNQFITDNPSSNTASRTTLSTFHHPASTLENIPGSEDDAEGETETDDQEKGIDEYDSTKEGETEYDESGEEHNEWMDSMYILLNLRLTVS